MASGMSLSGRLSLVVALIVAGVVASVAFLEMRAFERDIDGDLVDAAQLGARSAADAIAQRTEPFDALDLRDELNDLVEADPVLDAVSVIAADEAGHPRVFTTTSTEERAEVVDLAARAIAARTPASDRNDTVVMFAVPVPRHEHYAVVVTVGLESLLQARSQGVRVALGFAIPTILLVTVLVHLVVRQLVGRPLAAIVQTMEQTAAGDLHARTAMTRRDELGTIATRLNAMLDQLEQFNRSLQARVEEATADLSLRNAQLAASQHQLFAARESLGRAERVAALGQVAANVVHQAGTPLNLISGYVQMIRSDPGIDVRTRSRLQTVDTQIQQVTRVLQTMLDHARRPSGFETVVLTDILARVMDVARPRLSQANIQIRTSIEDAVPPIRADVTQLEMAILNLVNNALDAMPNGGTLSIAAATRAGMVRLEVADTGSGIPPGIMDRLFEPWVTTKPIGQGTGLGLAIVRDVARSHGGSVSAYNQSVGAVFVIELPASRPADIHS
jgi:signal transduction histidine kinase